MEEFIKGMDVSSLPEETALGARFYDEGKEGDALEILKDMNDTFDFIFMDAAKGQYIHFYPEVMRLLEPGGVLVSDNVLQEGDLIESHFAVERRNRTIYKRMRDYLYILKHDERLETSILPVGDGAAVSFRKETGTLEL